MPLGVVAFVADLTDKIEQTQEEHGVPRTNIMKYRLRGGMPCSSLYHIQLQTPQAFIEKTSDGLVYDTR